MAFMGCVGSHTHDARLQAIEEAVKVSVFLSAQVARIVFISLKTWIFSCCSFLDLNLNFDLQDNAISRLKSLLADGSVTSEELDRKHLLHSAAWMGFDKCTQVHSLKKFLVLLFHPIAEINFCTNFRVARQKFLCDKAFFAQFLWKNS